MSGFTCTECLRLGQCEKCFREQVVAESRRNMRDLCAAYILDRCEQYKPSSGIYEALNTVAWAIVEGEADRAYEHGELDDLMKRIEEWKKRNKRRTP